MHKNASLETGILGVSGYVGRELIQILEAHDGVSVRFATSESEARVEGVATVPIESAAKVLGEPDVVFSCLPHGISAPHVRRAREAGARVVDLSADLRLSREVVYGLTEVVRPSLPGASVVANPGCYPTVSLLGLLPLAASGAMDPTRPIVIDAASGVTGAGRSPKRPLMFSEIADNFQAYGVGNTHRHLPEIQRGLAAHLDAVDVIFTPHLLPVRRGILATMQVPLRDAMDREAVEAVFLGAYAEEPCVQLLPGGVPTLRDVVHRNRVAIGVVPVENVARPMVTVVAAIDNLVKGAAGQAVQNMNLMVGFDETRGLVC